MYKAIAAYAAALLAQPDKFMPAMIGNMPVWAVSKLGTEMYINLEHAHKLSILGAMRAGHDVLGGGARSFNTLDAAVRHACEVLHPDKEITTLDKDQAIEVLLSVARH